MLRADAFRQSRVRIAVMSASNQTDSNSWNSQEINLTLYQALQMRHLLLTTNVFMIFYLVFVCSKHHVLICMNEHTCNNEILFVLPFTVPYY